MKVATPALDHLTVADYDHVYEASEDTFLVLDALEQDMDWLLARNPTICLEIGSGSGCISTFLAHVLGSSRCAYFATDINSHASQCTVRTGDRNGVSIHAVVTDLTSGMTQRLHGAIDVLIFNPPYVPTPPEEMNSKGIEASWAGGLDGREVFNRLLPYVANLLSPQGAFYLVAVKENDPQGIITELREFGLDGEIVHARKAGREYLSILRFVFAAH